ncbi:DegV family protein [Anaeromicropila herbilytica]|uniref:DegV domain-containing protein n=1 Tax=Anaeromicropila herbilytica TaxID=2785025 RepID=A0A7R7EK59_9FIRM|nr:DegV family protein [Anaeromicropila herbilytica]BCN30264.1 DegV domain-containing protein [Anaeromicropila herbilytica]
MSYKIIGDSCTDLPQSLKNDEHFYLVPLSIQIDEYNIIDDATFDQKDFLAKVKESPNCPKSSCPAPEAFMNLFGGEDDIYVITLSSNLSGSYNSAVLARNLYLDENPLKNILVIDSCSASVGQTLIAMKIKELIESGLAFDDVAKEVTKYRDQLNTMFVLETLESLRKNGRLSNIKAFIASALNIKPIMGSTNEGTIIQLDQARGMNKALTIMVKLTKEDVKNPEERILGIAHCNNYERAVFVKEEMQKQIPFKDIVIVDTAGISSLYANDGGIVIAY